MDGHGSLKDHFTWSNVGKHLVLHVAIMGGLMFLTGAAAVAATMGTATLGDGLLQGFVYGNFEMMFGWVEHIPLLGDMFANAAEGNLMPGTTENLMNHGVAEHASHDFGAGGTEHAMHDGGSFTPEQDAQIRNQANRFGVDPDQYKQGWISDHSNI